ncbi:hypothetical protein [Providencia rettgeri]|uniref:hypothetical protein n=1 Tax=Providencia rettgeri TaxID=587 RepID=UPI0018C82799|nr:hypothetical protein [Providencia rettgeri]MBG5926731.1 hypothetical protein [Providencia rettgeri]
MGITLSDLSNNPTLFKKIINSDDFIKKNFTVTSSQGKKPLGADNQPKPTRSCSLESIDSPYESDSGEVYSIKYKKNTKFNKQLVYIHYKTCEENRPNQRITSLPKTTFEFKGNIPQTKSSLLRAQRIKEHYNLSSKITTQKTSLSKDNLVKNKILVNSSDLLKIIEKEYQLTQEMNNHIKIIAEIDAQMEANNQLLVRYKMSAG